MYALLLLTLLSLPQTCKQEWNRNPCQQGQSQESISHTQTLRWFHGFGDEPPIESAEYQQYDPRNDLLYRGYLIATIVGVFGGIIGLIFLYRQFVATKVAADAAKQSADAANRNADTIIEGQRAQLTVIIRTDPIEQVEAGQKPSVRFDVINKGPTAAFKCTYETWCEVMPVSPDPNVFGIFTDAATHIKFPDVLTIYSGAQSPTIAHVNLRRFVTQEELEKLRTAKAVLAFRIRFEYRDAFRKSRFQDFGFYAQNHGLTFLPRYTDSN